MKSHIEFTEILSGLPGPDVPNR